MNSYRLFVPPRRPGELRVSVNMLLDEGPPLTGPSVLLPTPSLEWVVVVVVGGLAPPN